MSALWVFGLASAACCLAVWGGTVGRTPRYRPAVRGRNLTEPRQRRTAESLPRVVRQLASLLAAGRSGPVVWGALAQVLMMEHTRRLEPPGAANSSRAASSPGMPDDAVLVLVLAVQRATALGIPTATAVRHSCGEAAVSVRRLRIRSRGKGPHLTLEQYRTWLDVAACFEVCEGSGAPVAAILGRLALSIEADQDAAALRETALAGPRATVRLLSWLPFLGLGLGMAMGVDPLGALLGSLLGWLVLGSGVVLSLIGRLWSAKLIEGASRAADFSPSRTGGVRDSVREFARCRRW